LKIPIAWERQSFSVLLIAYLLTELKWLLLQVYKCSVTVVKPQQSLSITSPCPMEVYATSAATAVLSRSRDILNPKDVITTRFENSFEQFVQVFLGRGGTQTGEEYPVMHRVEQKS